jgi:transcriptional regulator with XRE-family HTH domain
LLEIIQNLCKEKGISIFKLEKDLNFGNGTIYKWDKSSPAIDKLKKVADYFEVSIDYLIASSNLKQVPRAFTNYEVLRHEFAKFDLDVYIDDGPMIKKAIISHELYGELASMSVARFQEDGELLLKDLVREFKLEYKPSNFDLRVAEAFKNSIPLWATNQDILDIKQLLESGVPVAFDGVPITEEKRNQIRLAAMGLLWEDLAKHKEQTEE